MKIEINEKEIENIVGMYISDKYPDVKFHWQDHLLVADISIVNDKTLLAENEHQDTSTEKPEDNTVTGLFN